MFGVSLGIKVGNSNISGGGFDADAQAYFSRVTTAGGTLTTTEQNAVNQLVIDMKANGIWTAMKAIYPMVGASAAACAQNLKSSSFTGTFSSGWTFASTGATPNGSSAYMDTTLNTLTSLTLNSSHLSYYSRTNSAKSSELVMGNLDDTTGSSGLNLAVRRNTNLNSFRATEIIGVLGLVDSTSSDSRGLTLGSIISSSSRKLYKNGILLNTNTTNVTYNRANATLYIGASFAFNTGLATSYTDKQCAFASIGDGLNDTEATNLYTTVQTFQTTLSRNV